MGVTIGTLSDLQSRLVTVHKVEVSKEKCNVVRQTFKVFGNFHEKSVLVEGRQIRFHMDIDETRLPRTDTN